MRLAIMQPYIFPYIGYIQLIKAVDKFVMYDDVNFINRGWINRNRILVSGKENMFTVPLKDASQNKLINEVDVINDGKWHVKMLKTIEQAYKKAPYYQEVFPLISETLHAGEQNIAGLALVSLQKICQYLEIKTEIVPSSARYSNAHLKAQERIMDICLQEKASQYINPIGGTELYDKKYFEERSIQLNFIKSRPVVYQQFNNEFVAWLSIIDVLMFNSKEKVHQLLDEYELV
ncbi:WbqC-like protein family protein [Pseudarcicella hirudinis]|uniref:WbqC-like protein family protein n=1 Tax=Pseudarcicella hirudinis TaxID=1079859 RepID=A0A1I5Y5D1_9BACT|nr:WbqC family protein [Pseudarcicella hirudinis]SFQ39300.1 WbqC-like protein family protein [Pseudarcicella hirudinis]